MAMKKLAGLFLALTLAVGTIPAAVFAEQGLTLKVDGKEQTTDSVYITEGCTMVPLDDILAWYGISSQWNEQKIIIRHNDITLKLVLDSTLAKVNDAEVRMPAEPTVRGGHILVPLRFVCESLGSKVGWSAASNEIVVNTKYKASSLDGPAYLDVVSVSAIAHDGNRPENIVDNDYGTRWSCEGAQKWIMLELAETTTVGYAGIAWYQGNERTEKFSLEVSSDGTNFVKVFDGSSEDTLNMAAYTLGNQPAKYVRIVCNGNTAGMWNSITEVKIYPPQADGSMPVENANVSASGAMYDLPQEIRDALKRADELVDEKLLSYYIDLYDPETGGFYFTISGRDSAGFEPVGEGTRDVLTDLRNGGICKELPDWWKEKLVPWVQSHQSEEDGYFYEPMWGKNTDGNRRNRDLTYNLNILEIAGAEPLYPTAYERAELAASGDSESASVLPERLTSKEKMLEYLDSLNWSTAGIWTTGNELQAEQSMIKSAGLEDLVREYIASKQNKETGLWGDGCSWQNTNGAMKLSVYFDNENPYPNLEKMVDSVFSIYENEPSPSDGVYLWNALVTLTSGIQDYAVLPDEVKAKVYDKGVYLINLIVDRALEFRKPDGGYSRNLNNALMSASGGMPVGLGLYESDLDGTVIIGTRMRNYLYSLFGVKADNTYFAEYEDWFLEQLKNKAPIEKNNVHDFENYELGKSIGGGAVVAKDPIVAGNQCLKFSHKAGESISQVNLGTVGQEGYTKAIYSCRLLIEEINGSSDFVYNTVGSSVSSGAVQWGIDKNGSIFIRNASSGSPVKETVMDGLFYDNWYDLRIEYTPRGLTNSEIRIYVNGKQVAKSNNIYLGDKGDATEPTTFINGFNFRSFANGDGVYYLDDICITYQ